MAATPSALAQGKAVPEMKKQSSPPPRKTSDILTCLDTIDAHCGRLETLAGLLALCLESGCPGVDPHLVGSTGDLMLKEIEKLRGCRHRLGKELES